MKLIDMKLDPKAGETVGSQSLLSNTPEYPWGLRLDLTEDVVKRLELSSLPDVDKELMLHAKVKVTAISVSDFKETKQRNIQLQITALGLGDVEQKQVQPEDLYRVDMD